MEEVPYKKNLQGKICSSNFRLKIEVNKIQEKIKYKAYSIISLTGVQIIKKYLLETLMEAII